MRTEKKFFVCLSFAFIIYLKLINVLDNKSPLYTKGGLC